MTTAAQMEAERLERLYIKHGKTMKIYVKESAVAGFEWAIVEPFGKPEKWHVRDQGTASSLTTAVDAARAAIEKYYREPGFDPEGWINVRSTTRPDPEPKPTKSDLVDRPWRIHTR